ncbi:WD repeat-containing protein 19 [Perkinsus olseni]|uniref:WD repeat-containing protein 19 n=1 Tax=Perkinsus olseni TaxID=32597 RepID=A0A7J6NG95_PEROL|nr:WD repeat-containing protein 19 [Perkinsus olseni]
MAVRHDQMPVYERTLAEVRSWVGNSGGSPNGSFSRIRVAGVTSEGSDELVGERYRSVAGYYKERNLPLEAAKNYVPLRRDNPARRIIDRNNATAAAADLYEVAMELCLSLTKLTCPSTIPPHRSLEGVCGSLSPHMDLAIDIAGRCHDEGLVNRLVDHPLRANTGLEDDELGYHQAQSIYKLHQALGNYEESARIAMLIAKREQDEGRYSGSVPTVENLQGPDRLEDEDTERDVERLMLLQSYILVKPLSTAR